MSNPSPVSPEARSRKQQRSELIDKMTDYEAGSMSRNELVSFFQELVDSGLAWELEGHYARMTDALLKKGVIKINGGRRNQIPV